MSPFIRRWRRFPSPFPILFIAVVTTAIILYGRGYRPDFTKNTLKPTGLLSATSDPKGAQVFVEGKLKTATDNTINIDPGWYTVNINKEGYISWQKKLRVQGEVVTKTDAFLFPANPSLSPLTNTGIQNPVLSSDGTKIAYTIPLKGNENTSAAKAGLWVYELVERPLGLNRDPKQLGISEIAFNFSEAKISWSPDSAQVLVQFGKVVRLYNTARTGDYQDVSLSYQGILRNWDEQKQTKDLQKLAAFKQPIVNMATSSARIISFSPDETKILYEATASATIPQILTPPLIGTNPTEEKRDIEPGKFYVYDSREDKNYFVLDKNELPAVKVAVSPSPATKRLPTATPQLVIAEPNIHWFPTSRHLVLTLEGKVDIMEYDRTNWVTVYAGPFADDFLAPYPSGSRIIVVTNLNPGVSTLPNLYTVNLR